MPGGGGGGSAAKIENVDPTGPARLLASYPQYNPMTFGPQPGQQTQQPGLSQIQSFMPAIQQMQMSGGLNSPLQLLAALQQGLPGTPSQGLGQAQMPQMGQMAPTPNTIPADWKPPVTTQPGKKNKGMRGGFSGSSSGGSNIGSGGGWSGGSDG